MILIGELSLWVALLMATWAATVSFAGGAQRRGDLIASGERGIYAAFLMVALASLGLWTALLTHDFSFSYVAAGTSANLPLVYSLAAFWGGQAGSLLFWALALAGCSAVAVFANRVRNRALMPYVTGTLGLMLAFFLTILCLGVNPYERLEWIPMDGSGMAPLYQNPGMALHPPALYLGLVATAVPFAFAIAALIEKRIDREWLAAARRWVLASWLFLTIGILSGLWWAHVEPGREGDWAWDAVENASLLAWLINGLFLRATTAGQTRASLLKLSLTLVPAAFLLSVFGMVVLRGGIISSVHSFSQPPVRNWLAGFLVVCVAASAYLAATRLHGVLVTALETTGSEPGARDRSRFGWYMIYLGIAVVFVALAGQSLRKNYDVTLSPGEVSELRDPFGRVWKFASQGVSGYNELNRRVVAASLEISRDGRSRGFLKSEKRQYMDSRGMPIFAPSTESGIKGSLTQDVYVVLTEVEDSERTQLRISFHPLVMWVWIAGFITVLGIMIVMWADAGRGRVTTVATGNIE